MSEYYDQKEKPTIKTRLFKLEDGKEFVLEYPSNYNEIVDRKLKNLEKEYDDVVNLDGKVIDDDNNNKENKTEVNTESNNIGDKKEHTNNITHKNSEEGKKIEKINQNEIKEENYQDNYYQPLQNEENQEDDFIEVPENTDEIIPDKDNIEEVMKDFEFIEDKPSSNKNLNTNTSQTNPPKRKHSPIKNPEKIKASMRTLNIKPPKWAESLSDKDFFSCALNHLNKKSK